MPLIDDNILPLGGGFCYECIFALDKHEEKNMMSKKKEIVSEARELRSSEIYHTFT